MGEKNISVLLDEKRVFKPKEDFVNQTNVKKWMEKNKINTTDELYKKAENIEWFWNEISKEFVEWYKPYSKVVEWDAPWAKWFVDAKYNIVNDALDKHVKSWRKSLKSNCNRTLRNTANEPRNWGPLTPRLLLRIR